MNGSGRPPRAWQRMLSGRRLDILDPSPLDVELDDIAHGIARVARWNGQTVGRHIFSVAQHSCFVEAIALEMDPDLSQAGRLHALLHDAPEYVLGDVITPLKSALGPSFTDVEARLLAAIHVAFGLPASPPASLTRLIKRADRVAAWVEATRLADFSTEEADSIFGRPVRVPAEAAAFMSAWPPDDAAARFRARVRACLPTKRAGHGRTL